MVRPNVILRDEALLHSVKDIKKHTHSVEDAEE